MADTHISTHLIADALSQHYTITQHIPCESATLCSLRIYDSLELQPNCLYLIRPEQLMFVDTTRTDVAFVCPDVEKPLGIDVSFGLITLREFIPFELLINRTLSIFEGYNRWDAELRSAEA